MKQLKFLAAFVFLFIAIVACENDPIINEKEKTIVNIDYLPSAVEYVEGRTKIVNASRSGTYAAVYDLKNAYLDNYPLYNEPRTQIAFNISKIDSVFMSRANSEVVNVDGLDHWFYNLTIRYFDLKSEKYFVLAPIVGETFNYKPQGQNCLAPTNTYRYIKLRKLNTPYDYFNHINGKMAKCFDYAVGTFQVDSFETVRLHTNKGSIYTFPK